MEPTVTSEPVSRDDRWTKATSTPLIMLALGFLVAYAVPILLPDAPQPVLRAARWFELFVWGVFAADYAARLWLAPDRRRFFRTNLLDLAAAALPMIRALRLLPRLSVVTLNTSRREGAAVQAATTYVLGVATKPLP